MVIPLVVNLKRDGYDVAIRATGTLEPGLIARPLSRVSLVGVASPAYLSEHGAPRTLADLRQHRCLMGFDRDERAQTHWAPRGRKFALAGATFSNDPHLVLRFVERGLGIAFLPWTLVATPITRGDLVTVLPKLLRLEGSISIVYAERKLMPPQVRVFVDWMTEHAPAALGSANAQTSRRVGPNGRVGYFWMASPSLGIFVFMSIQSPRRVERRRQDRKMTSVSHSPLR